MAAITPTTLKKINVGSANLIIAKFSTQTISDGDTYASNCSNIIDYWFTQKTASGVDCPIESVSADGTFTFDGGGLTTFTGTLFILQAGI